MGRRNLIRVMKSHRRVLKKWNWLRFNTIGSSDIKPENLNSLTESKLGMIGANIINCIMIMIILLPKLFMGTNSIYYILIWSTGLKHRSTFWNLTIMLIILELDFMLGRLMKMWRFMF